MARLFKAASFDRLAFLTLATGLALSPVAALAGPEGGWQLLPAGGTPNPQSNLVAVSAADDYTVVLGGGNQKSSGENPSAEIRVTNAADPGKLEAGTAPAATGSGQFSIPPIPIVMATTGATAPLGYFLYSSFDGRVFISTNKGRTWQDDKAPGGGGGLGSIGKFYSALECIPPNRCYALNNEGAAIYKAQVNSTWTALGTFPELAAAGADLDFVNESLGFAVTTSGDLCKGTPVSSAIHKLTPDATTGQFGNGAVTTLITGITAAVSRISMGSCATGYAGGTSLDGKAPVLYKTTDGGTSWTALTTLPTSITYKAKNFLTGKEEDVTASATSVADLFFFDAKEGFAVMTAADPAGSDACAENSEGGVAPTVTYQGWVLYTKDGGQSWSRSDDTIVGTTVFTAAPSGVSIDCGTKNSCFVAARGFNALRWVRNNGQADDGAWKIRDCSAAGEDGGAGGDAGNAGGAGDGNGNDDDDDAAAETEGGTDATDDGGCRAQGAGDPFAAAGGFALLGFAVGLAARRSRRRESLAGPKA
jgi:hypothetical protein